MTLPLIRACIARGVPVFGICRGFQEFNVAFGGTLHPEIREIPGRMNHRMPPDGTLEEKFEYRHTVRLTEGGQFHHLLGAREVMVNSLHGQGILDKGGRIVIEGYAPDETPEAIVVEQAPAFAMAVQWHPEWNAANDPVSRPLFQAFGTAFEPRPSTGATGVARLETAVGRRGPAASGGVGRPDRRRGGARARSALPGGRARCPRSRSPRAPSSGR